MESRNSDGKTLFWTKMVIKTRYGILDIHYSGKIDNNIYSFGLVTRSTIENGNNEP